MPRTRPLLLIAALATVAALLPAASTSASPLPAAAPALVAPAALSPVAQLRLTTTPVVSGLVAPVLVRSANDGTSRLFVVEQAGRIRTVLGSTITGTYLDLRSIVTSGGERGLLGLAFPKDFAKSRYFWVSYTRSDGALVIARFQARSATTSTVLPGTRRIVMVIPHPVNANHNGGNIEFGADGYLYIGTGDGGGAGDPRTNAQSLRSLLGKMLRVNVRCAAGPTYCVPPTNPYATSTVARHEIWMSGLRNPWRWSFDTTGAMWIGDVGQNKYEEIDAISATSAKRRNLGWSCREGKHVYNAGRCRSTTTYTAPVLELCHPDGVSGCAASRAGEAIIGGYVYRGATYANALGTYVFGDYVTGRIWPYRSGILGTPTALAGVSGFGVQDNREIYAVTLDGGLYRLGFTVV
jgi:glucose/arabinose dehydrogenase